MSAGSDRGVFARIFRPAGTPAGNEIAVTGDFLINQTEIGRQRKPSITMLPDVLVQRVAKPVEDQVAPAAADEPSDAALDAALDVARQQLARR